MKKVLSATCVILFCIIIYLVSCKPDQIHIPAQPPGNLICSDTTCGAQSGDDQMTGLINFQLAQMMSRNYAADRGKRYIWNGDFCSSDSDATSIWFDLAKLKKFIRYMERSACRAGCNSNATLGIRMYYIRYPDTTTMRNYHDLDGVPLEFAQHHALMMSPTIWDPILRMHIDFDPKATGSNCRFPLPNPTDSSHTFGILPDADSDNPEDNLQNHGSLMPPPANHGLYPTTGN